MNAPVSAGPWENPVTARLRQGLPVVGLTITVNCVEVAALGASMGFDFLWVEMEHSPVSLETLRQIVLATRGSRAVPFARVPVNEVWTAKRVLDMGVSGVVFPFTSTPELANQASQACRYPPTGCRGSGPVLAMTSWPERAGYHDSADRNVLVVTVIEQECAVDCVEQIAATPGIDVLFIGTSDLSFSLGLRGAQDHPRLHAAIAKVVAAGKKHGKFLGLPLRDPKRIEEHIRQGFLFFQATTELGLMEAGARQLFAAVEQPAEVEPSSTPHT
ncbi:MAG TPA: aldolase/citrate lyase family protein [Bryobacteraceae bacterium]|nr:aldolase/citrate lyase family protein [Bryobacteraceae bacterium]